jgi:Uma2 family endonuclease
MSTTIRLTFQDFERLPEQEGIHYELDQGELVMEASPTFLHNLIRDRIATRLSQFAKSHRLGVIIVEMDFRLATDTVRNPDVAFLTAKHVATIDLNRSPVDGAPALAIEVISPSNLAQDTLKKVGQYLSAGTKVVWVIHPSLHVVEIHTVEEVRHIKEPGSLSEDKLFAPHSFSISLDTLFSADPYV